MKPYNEIRHPSRSAYWLFRLGTAWRYPAEVEEMEADLLELYAARKAEQGETAARRLYWRDVLSVCRRATWNDKYHYPKLPQIFMWSNYIIIALRNMRKHQGLTFINMAGLTLGLACCLLLVRYVYDEFSYDRQHPQAEQTYRVVLGRDGPTLAQVSAPVGPQLVEVFPEIESTVRIFQYWRTPLIGNEATAFLEENVYFADSTFFEIFATDFVQGNPKTALRDPFAIVLTTEKAQLYFGDTNPIGQQLTFNVGQTYTVTGVVEPAPTNTHFRFDFLAAFHGLPELLGWDTLLTNWGLNAFSTYITVAPSADLEALAPKLIPFLEEQTGRLTSALFVQPVTDIHLHSHLSGEIGTNSDIRYVYLLAAITGLLLLIACINYMNLATARASVRAKEVGIRKVSGATRKQVALQFLSESIVVVLIATGLALALAWFLLPAVNAIIGKQMTASFFFQGPVLLGLLGGAIVLGMLAGSYPAILLSGFKPIGVLKGSLGMGTDRGMLRKGLVVFQFAISITLMVSTVVIYKQLSYVQNSELGFDKEGVVVLPVRDTQVRDQMRAFRNSLLQHPRVINVSESSSLPSNKSKPTSTVSWEGAPTDSTLNLTMSWVDEHFLETLGLTLVTGRFFSQAFPSDPQEAVVLNEAAVAAMGWTSPQDALGQSIYQSNQSQRVVGVIQDYHFRSLHEAIEPLALYPREPGLGYITVRIQAADMPSTIAFLEQTWQAFAAEQPFTYDFLDADLRQLYAAEQQWAQVIGYAALLTILVACLGLLGLAAFTAEQRTKEISIRKSLGASTAHIVLLLSRDFTRLLLLAFVLAVPIAYFGMEHWLNSFAYRTDIGVLTFVWAGGVAFLIAGITVGHQAVKAAWANPIHTLRYE